MSDRPDSDDSSDDPMGPPKESCECWCLHCRRTFMSNQMWFQRVVGAKDGFPGFWMCPTPNCGGAGFTMDIFPTDPAHPANDGWHYDDDDEEYDEDEFYDDEFGPSASDESECREWDPQETKYKEMDEAWGDEEEDIVGEEWKHGLEPGAEPPEPPWAKEAREEWEKEQERYDQPDERPRELDWSHREDQISEDDIPF